MDSALTVRLYQPSDAARLTVLLHSAYAELGARGLNYTAVDQDEETTATRAGGGRCWVVEESGRMIGTLTMSLPPSSDLQDLTPVARVGRRAWLNQVAVSPTERSRGIAAGLWELGKQWAASRGATSVGVDTAVPADHLVRLYSAWGFTQEDTIHWPGKRYDSVVMTRPLTSNDAAPAGS